MLQLSPMASVELSDVAFDNTVNGWDLAFAAVTLVSTWILARLARRATLDLLGRVNGIEEDLRLLAARIAKYFTWVVGAGVALSFLGAEIQPLLSATLIVAVVAVLTLRSIAENFGAGLVIQTRRPIQLGDSIESLGFTGNVTALNGRAVVVETVDGRTVHLPNAEVLRQPIVNDSVKGRRRSDIEVRVAAGVDRVDEIEQAITAALSASVSIDHDNAPVVTTTAIEPERITVRVTVWHTPDDAVAARSSSMQAIAVALADRELRAALQSPPPTAPVTPPAPL